MKSKDLTKRLNNSVFKAMEIFEEADSSRTIDFLTNSDSEVAISMLDGSEYKISIKKTY